MEHFIQLEEAHGRQEVEKAYRYIALKHPSNPRRSAAYFIEVIKPDDKKAPASKD